MRSCPASCVGHDAITHVLSGGSRGGTDTENRKYVMTGAAAGGEGEEPHTQEGQVQKLGRACRGSMALSIPWFWLPKLLPDFWPPEL